MNDFLESTVGFSEVDAGFSYFVWAIAVTALFHAIQDFRKKEMVWGYIYLGVSGILFALGFLWPLLPSAVSAILSARSDQIFFMGALISATIYSFVRRSWVVRGDRRFVSGFGEGIAIFVFLTLVMSPFLPERIIVEIFVNSRPIFVLGGISGLLLIVLETLRGEITPSTPERTQ